MAEKTIEQLTDEMVESIKIELGPIYKTEANDTTLKNIVVIVRDEAFEVANRMFETTMDFNDLKSIIFHASTIAYENRGIEGQTSQDELGQKNAFIDWHNYLKNEVISHGKRFLI